VGGWKGFKGGACQYGGGIRISRLIDGGGGGMFDYQVLNFKVIFVVVVFVVVVFVVNRSGVGGVLSRVGEPLSSSCPLIFPFFAFSLLSVVVMFEIIRFVEISLVSKEPLVVTS
jgi:hypothetical protein